MLVVHDCLRILKYLSLTAPTEELLFSEDNLLIKDGRVKLSDPFLSKAHLQQELLKIRRLSQ